MTFEQAKYKYNCYARDVLGLVGELEIPSRDKSTVLEEYPLWVLRNDDYETIAIIDADTGKVLWNKKKQPVLITEALRSI